jgi:hypothetical protein
VIGYVQVHTENFELFRPSVQFTCTEHGLVTLSMHVTTAICPDIKCSPSYRVSDELANTQDFDPYLILLTRD